MYQRLNPLWAMREHLLLPQLLMSTCLALALMGGVRPSAYAGPQFSVRYHADCAACHSNFMPRLNLTGQMFKARGYRFDSNEVGVLSVRTLPNYIAMIPKPTSIHMASGLRGTTLIDSFRAHVAGPLGHSRQLPAHPSRRERMLSP